MQTSKAPLTGLHGSARRCLDRQQYKEAEFHLLKILKKDIQDHAGLAMLAELKAAQGKIQEAVVFYMMAVNAHPDDLSYKEKMIELGGARHVGTYEELTENAILACLNSAEHLDCQGMQILWATHLMSMPAFHAAYNLSNLKGFDPANKVFFDRISNFRPLLTPYFLLGIKNIVVAHVVFEEFITHIRKCLLEDFGVNQKMTAAESLALSAALAHYSFHTDYILDCTDEEQKKVDALRDKVEADGGDAVGVALLACYMPLYKLKNSADLARFSDISDVIKMQVTDYAALRKTAAEIKAATPIDDDVSVKVQEQYEEFPYPRWKSVSPASIVSGWKTAGQNDKITAHLKNKPAKILIAGCGTGREAIMFSILFPNAEVLAVDLSRSSLAYATNKATEYGVKNLTLRHGDILRLGVLEDRYDLIVSGGVLHHMKEPVRGWEVLCGLLKQDGLMMIGLYSKVTRWSVIRAREVVAREGYTPDANGMRRFRRNSPQILEPAVLESLCRFSDYYYLNAYRDLVFHAQEENYDLPEIAEILDQLKLKFVDFALVAPVAGTDGSLESWHRLEASHPDKFIGMYIFWCRKAS